MAKFSVGQSVEIAFNPPTPDPRVPDQVNGRFPGRGEYQTKPEKGEVLEVHELEEATQYLVLVNIERIETRTGKPYVVVSKRKRLLSEAKLRAVS